MQRVEPSGGGRGDEWADPWMRSKSPGGRGKTARLGGARRQSYSSASSYSSSRYELDVKLLLISALWCMKLAF